jgi:glycosyltransferase involved in cell wall biosynthesis
MPMAYSIVCLSHLRWDFVFQRPQHLLSRFAREHRVFYVEEPVFDAAEPRLAVSLHQDGIWIVVPHLPEGMPERDAVETQRSLIDQLFEEHRISEHVLWYYTPMAVPFTRHLRPLVTVYDCMDELSAFRGAPPAMRANEAELFRRADLVFTGGQSLNEAKRSQHHSVHLFPSSVDRAHFARARDGLADPDDQQGIPHPRLGFFGVLDERLDLDLLGGVADARPDWHLVIIGPVAKIDPSALPIRSNVHYLGPKRYRELPAYLGGWDVALMPFARNESTRFISPTKTPEYLAAGKPVISTPIRDVVRPYGAHGLVRIAETCEQFVAAIEDALVEDGDEWRRMADAFLSRMSWDRTWKEMTVLVDDVIMRRMPAPAPITIPTIVTADAADA